MKVIEVAPAKRQLRNFYTIVGAVERSGVFHAPEGNIKLTKLIEVAGGLKGADSTSIRIVRNGQSGLQLYYIADKQYSVEIQSGDIVVVVPSADQTMMTSVDGPYIPIACIGLHDRPIVIPVAAEIQSVDRILSELGQSQELQRSLRTLDPLGDSQSGRLIPGTVLFFDSSKVDYAALETTSKLPSAVPLENQLKPETEAGSKQPLAQEMPVIQRAESNLGDDRRPLQERLHLQGAGSSEQTNEPRIVHEPPQLLIKSQEPIITVEGPELVTTRAEGAGGQLNAGISNGGDAAFTPQVSGLPNIDLLPEANVPNFASELVTTDAEANSEPTMAPPPPLTSRTLRVFSENSTESKSPVESDNGRDIRLVRSEQVEFNAQNVKTNSASQSTSQLLLIVFGLGGIALICLGLSILWSRKERHRLRRDSDEPASVGSADASRHSVHKDRVESLLQQVLAPEIPIIEEAVLLPSEISMHGEPVGQRRIIFHDKPEKLKGHHFGARRKPMSRKAVVESTLTNQSVQVSRNQAGQSTSQLGSSMNEASIDEDIVQRPVDCEPNDVVISSASSEEHSMVDSSSEFQRLDVVIPVDHDLESSGPLERALRLLAQEKKV